VVRSLLRGDLDDARAQAERSSSPAAEVFLAAIVTSAPGKRPVSDARLEAAVERQRQEANQKLRSWVWILGTIGATAPFVGLFGTVVGIMRAFHQMGVTGQGGFSVVAAGISEALITTAGGIAVAIEAVIVYNSNPVAVAPESRKVQAGFAREDLFTVVLEHFLTDTADHADYVLPATTQLEHWDVHCAYGHTYALINQPAIEPLGECRPNTAIFRALAARLGFDDDCFGDDDETLGHDGLRRRVFNHPG